MLFRSKAFNEQTKGREGLILPAVITVYKDKSFDFIIKTPPSSVLIKKAANLAKASGDAGKQKIVDTGGRVDRFNKRCGGRSLKK